MTQGPETGGYYTSEDEKILHKLGYAQELFRAMGGFRNFAISFTIISILAGCLTSYTIAFEHGGPVAVTWGWLLVGLMSTIIALSMAEIASAYPTAGGLYYWASKLGSPGWGWATGWFNLIGQVAVTAAIGYGLARLRAGALRLLVQLHGAHERLVRSVVQRLDLHPLRGLLARGHADQRLRHPDHVGAEHDLGLVAHDRRRCHRRRADLRPGPSPVAQLRVHGDGQQLGLRRRDDRRSGTRCSGSSSGSGCSCRSTRSPGSTRPLTPPRRRTTPRAWRRPACGPRCSSRSIFGWILLLSVTFAIPSTEGGLDTANALLPIVPWIWAESMSQDWAEFLLFICVVAQFFCVTASLTSASRMMFAFSRDRAVPGHQLWRRVSRHRVPVWSVCGIALFAAILMIPAVWNYFVGYAVGTAIAVIGLYIAFILPVWLRWRKGDSWDEPRAWSLGRHYKWINLHRDPLGRADLDPLHLPAVHGRPPLERSLRLAVHELHDPVVRCHRPHLRRLVGRCPRSAGSRARSAWAPRKSWSGTRRSSRRRWSCPRPRPSREQVRRARAARLRRQAPERARPPGRAAPAYAFRGSRRSACRPPWRTRRQPPCPRRR